MSFRDYIKQVKPRSEHKIKPEERVQDYLFLDEGVLDSLRNAGRFLTQKIKSAARFVSNQIKRAMSTLKFGNQVKISLNYATQGKSLNEAVDKLDLKSRMGYYSEFCTAYELAKMISGAGGNMRGLTEQQLLKHRNDYKANKLLCNDCEFGAPKSKVVQEAKRMEDSGIGLAKSIWSDIKQNATDLQVTEFEVKLTGESGKGITKADIELIAYKKSTNKVIDHIEASLKAYKDWNINVSNSTFTSWVINLLAPDIGGFQTKSTVEAKVTEFIKRFGLKKQMRRIQELQSGEQSPAKLKKTIGRPAAKKMVDDEGVYIEVRNLMIDVFEKNYKKRKKEINENFMKLLGFDGADDLYLAVQKKTGGEVAVLSSRTSKGFNEILDSMKEDFDIVFEKSNDKVNTSITFKSGNNILFKSNFGFRDLDKVSQFVSFKDWQ
jgi:hypothetical protein